MFSYGQSFKLNFRKGDFTTFIKINGLRYFRIGFVIAGYVFLS